jgi:HK97 family phage prohead protease
MEPIYKTFEIQIVQKSINGGRILINTASLDRQGDRVFPSGARVENYLKNPVVQWGHNYKDPFATIGRTTNLIKAPDGLVADFELRPAANDQDPQNIVRLLWEGDWVRTASIGFMPTQGKPNNTGGMDFAEWELLEWSLVPIPANAEALRLAVKSMDSEAGLQQADATLEDQTPPAEEPVADAPPLRAWVRKLTALTERGLQESFATFYTYTIAVPDNATLLQLDDTLSECTEVPHPEAGHTVEFKTMVIVPPLEFVNLDGEPDGLVSATARNQADEQMLPHVDYWHDVTWSPVIDSIAVQVEKQLRFPLAYGLPVDTLTLRTAAHAGAMVKHLNLLIQTGQYDPISKQIVAKRGRVLSGKNEGKITQARDLLNEVLAEIDQQPEQPEPPEQDAARAALPVITLPCPFGCGAMLTLIGWGLYRCAQCHGAFEVVGEGGDLIKEFPKALSIEMIEAGLALKGAIPPHETPMADPDTSWDAGAVLRDLPNERAVLRKVHAWVDSAGDPDVKQSYKFPHHLADGRVVLRGVNNAKARLSQANIPEGDQAGVLRHLERHQAQFEKSFALHEAAQALHEAAAELGGAPHLSDDEERNLVESLQNLLQTVKEVIA